MVESCSRTLGFDRQSLKDIDFVLNSSESNMPRGRDWRVVFEFWEDVGLIVKLCKENHLNSLRQELDTQCVKAICDMHVSKCYVLSGLLN